MSAIQETTQKTADFVAKVKQAKNAAGHTNQSLADASGLSVSTVAKLLSGASGEPKLSDAAALALTLGISLDELCGLTPPAPPEPPSEELVQRVRALELEEVESKTQVAELRTRLKAILPLVYGLCTVCIFLAMGLTVYLLGDSQYPDVGLIKWGAISGPAWFLICIIVASVGTTALLVYRVTHSHREIKDE